MISKPTLTIPGHSQEVVTVAFSPKGKRLASGSYDKTIKIWPSLVPARVFPAATYNRYQEKMCARDCNYEQQHTGR